MTNPYEPPVVAELAEPVRKAEPVRRFRFPWIFGLVTAWGPLAGYMVIAEGRLPADEVIPVLRLLSAWGVAASAGLCFLRIVVGIVRGH